MPRKKNKNLSFYIGAAAVAICLVSAGFLMIKKTFYPGEKTKSLRISGLPTGTIPYRETLLSSRILTTRT